MTSFDQAGGLGEIIDNKSRLCISVVHGCERSKPFLARRIPYLEFDCSVREIAFLSQEGRCTELMAAVCSGTDVVQLHTANGWFFVLLKVIVHEAKDKG